MQHLTRSVREAEQIGWHGVIGAAALELAVALAEATQPTLAAELLGYAETHFVSHTMRDASYTGFKRGSPPSKDASGDAESTAARETDRLDRRGFMRLLTDAEHGLDPTPGPRSPFLSGENRVIEFHP